MAIQLDALGETGPFAGFVEADFAAFERKKWSSRVYTLERRAARQKLVAVARSVLERDPERFEGLELGASDDAPSMANSRKVSAVWAYLTRAESVRRALSSRLAKNDLADAASLFDIAVEHEHASLLFAIHEAGVRLELHFSPRARVDRLNAARKLDYEEDRAELLRLCGALPEGTSVGFESALTPAAEVDAATIEGWRSEIEPRKEPFVVRLDYAREAGALTDEGWATEAAERLEPMVDVMRHLAWSRDNDFAKIGVEQTVEKAEKKLSKTKKAAEVADGALAPGTRVTILSGLFAGRAGYLAEQEGKGKVKVMVGPVSVSVPVGDVKAG